MDLGLRRLAVGVVGLFMAFIGLFLSVTIPVIVAILPQLQGRTHEELLVQPRRRIMARAIPQHPQENSSPTPPQAVLRGADAAESSASSDTLYSLVSSTHHATSTPPSSLHNSPGVRTNGLPLASSSTQGKSDGKCRAALQHVCTPQKCSGRATTSASGSIPEPKENTGTCASRDNRVADINEVTRKKNMHTARRLSGLKASPSSPLHFQLTRRSSTESTRSPAVVSPTRAATFDEAALDPNQETHLRLRRARSLFGLRRSSKASARAGFDPTHAAVHMTPIDEVVRTEPTSPSGSHDLHEELSDAESPARERKRRVSYLSRLKRKYSGKRKVESMQPHEGHEHDDSVPATDSPQSDGRGRSLKKRSSRRLCERHRKSAGAPAAPAPRTNPYDAPYYFPSPASPEAVNYVQLARSENRTTSVSPSTTSRSPYAKEPGSARLTMSPGPGVTHLPGTNSSLLHSASSQPHNTLVRNVEVVVSATGRHRNSVFDSTVSPAADEFGVVLPMSTPAGQTRTLKRNLLTN